MRFQNLESCNCKPQKVMADLAAMKDLVPRHDHYYEFYLRYAKDVLRIALGGPYRFLMYVAFDDLMFKEEAANWLCKLAVELEEHFSPERTKLGGYAFKGVVIDPLFRTRDGYTLFLAINDQEVLARRKGDTAKALLAYIVQRKWDTYAAMKSELVCSSVLDIEVLNVKKQSDCLQKLEELCGPDVDSKERVYLATSDGCA